MDTRMGFPYSFRNAVIDSINLYWFVVYIRRVIYKILNVCPFDNTAVAGVGRWARKPVTTPVGWL